MKMRMLCALLMLAVAASPVLAGWVIESNETSPGGELSKQTIYFQNNMMKIVDEDGQTVIFDVAKGEMYVLMPEQNMYIAGKPEDLMNAAKSMADKMKEAMMAHMTPEQKEAYEKLMDESKAEAAAAKTYDVKKTSEKATVAGYSTLKYQVYSGETMEEEAWISSDIKAGEEIDLQKVRTMMEAMAGEGEALAFEASSGYLALLEQGFPLKTISYEQGQPADVSEAVRVEKKTFPASEFAVPEGYQRMTIDQMYGGMMGEGMP
jgi:hypothetical protein